MANAIYPGSFDPFTNGHLSVLEKAIKVFDTVYIVVSSNPLKHERFSMTSRVKAIETVIRTKEYKDRIAILTTNDTIPARIATTLHCDYIIRGIRNSMDYNYEEGLALYNKEYNSSIETIYFRADNSVISSTMVNAFMKESVDVDKYLPYDPNILKRI